MGFSSVVGIAIVLPLFAARLAAGGSLFPSFASPAPAPAPVVEDVVEQPMDGPIVVDKMFADAVSDPVLTGFDKQEFEFLGKPGLNYTLLADATLAVNMRLVPAGPRHIRHQGGEGTFAGEIAVLLPFFELYAQTSEAGNMTVTVNGQPIDIEQPCSWDEASYEPYVPDRGQVLSVTHSPFSLKLIAVKAFTDAVSGYNRGHFDVHAEILSPITSPVSGVLGETLGAFDVATMEESAFEIPNLGYHKVAAEMDRVRVSVSRRLSSVEHKTYPLHASLLSASQ